MVRSHFSSVLALLLALSFLAMPGAAQSINGSISGKVMDASGAVITSAKISVKNLETGITRDGETDSTGVYRVRALPVGQYSISFSAEGFETVVRQPIQISVAVDAAIDATLQPGTTKTVIAVTEEAPLIEATQSQISKGVTAMSILSLPGLNQLNGLVLLQAGAVPNQNSRPGSGFSMNGGRTRSNNFTIDGAENNDVSLSTPRMSLVPEYMQEFRIITNNFSGEFGRNSSSVVAQITKSGGNEFHGIERWAWSGNGLDGLTTSAERTFNTQKATGLSDYLALRKARGVIVNNLAVLSLGGPIKKNKAFFYAGYDGNWYRSSAMPTSTAISPASFDQLSLYKDRWATGTLDFLKANFPLANDPTSSGTVNITVPGTTTVIPVAMQQYNPGLNGALSYGYYFWRWIAKGDIKLSDTNALTGRYLIQDQNDPGSPTAIAANRVGQFLRDQSATLNDVWSLKPTVVNEARMSFNRRSLHFPENMGQTISINNLPTIGSTNYPQYRISNDWEYTDNVTWVKGRHTIKTGANLAHLNLASFFPANLRGQIQYGSLSDFLQDKNAVYSKYTGQPDFNAITWEFGGFAQDDFRLKPNFTLNLGVRYEYDSAPLGFFSDAKPDINNFAPRVGFAWRPKASSSFLNNLFGNDKMSIRGGFSLAYDQIFQNVLSNVFRNYPRGIGYSTASITGGLLFNPANQPKVPTPAEMVASGLFDPAATDYRNWSTGTRISQPYTMQFSLGIERQMFGNYALKVFYIGSRGIKLVREAETNYGFMKTAVDANPATYANVLPNLQYSAKSASVSSPHYRVNPNIGGRVVGSGLAESTYHSMQVTFEKRYSNGIQFQANYTWSSMINDSDDILGGAVNSTVAAVPFNFKLDRGRSGFDQPQRLVVNFTYELPFLKEQRNLLGKVVGGWMVSGTVTESSGTPYTVYNAYNALGTITNGQLSTVWSNQRASVNQNGTPGTGTSTGLTTPYFIANPTNSGIIGNLGRNTQRTGGTNNLDASLQKAVRLFGERRHELQLRWEVFDALGHRNFTTIPSNTVSNSTNLTTFLNLGRTNVAGRAMQFMVRYAF